MDERIEMSALGAWLRGQSKALTVASRDACFSAAQGSRGLVLRSIEETGPYKPVDTGMYRAGWTATREAYGASLWNAVPYAGFIEVGTAPHFAPYQVLLEWAARKMRGQRPVSARAKSKARTSTKAKGSSPKSTSASARPKSASGGARKGRIRVSDFEAREAYLKFWDEVEGLARRAQNAIAKKGMAPRNVMLRAVPKMETLLAREVSRHMRRYAKGRGQRITKVSEDVGSDIETEFPT